MSSSRISRSEQHHSAQYSAPNQTAVSARAADTNNSSKPSVLVTGPMSATGPFKNIWNMILLALTHLLLAALSVLIFNLSRGGMAYTKVHTVTYNLLAKSKKWLESTLNDRIKNRKLESSISKNLIKRFEASDVQPCLENIEIGPSVEVLCTYEWKRMSTDKDSKDQPTIYVPGFGRRFKAPSMPHKVMRDVGEFWRDQHVVRVFHQQFEPMFQALSVMNPNITFNDVDVVIGRSNLLVLLDWVQGDSAPYFRFQVKMVKKTLFLHGTKGKSFAQQNTYGHSFEADFTKATSDADTDGYHRAIRYKLGPITLVVRLEVDAFLDESVEEVTDDLFHGHRTIDSPKNSVGIAHSHATSVEVGGRYVPHSLIAELKIKKEKYEQLWAGYYSLRVVGDSGSAGFGPDRKMSREEKLDRVNILQQDKEMRKAGKGSMVYSAEAVPTRKDWEHWEKKSTSSIQKLAGFLKDLIESMNQVERGKAILEKDKGKESPLELLKSDGNMVDALPKEIVDIFWN